jgi:hypothetical protein
MKLKSYEAIKKFIGNGKTCAELFPVVDLRYYNKLYHQGKFYWDDAKGQHRVK